MQHIKAKSLVLILAVLVTAALVLLPENLSKSPEFPLEQGPKTSASDEPATPPSITPALSTRSEIQFLPLAEQPEEMTPEHEKTHLAEPAMADGDEPDESTEELFLTLLLPLFEFDFELNNDGIAALNIFVSRLPEDLTQTDIARLKELILTLTTEESGQQLADTVSKLYALRIAEQQLTQTLETPITMQDMFDQNEQLTQLRYRILGASLAQQFYGDDKPDQPSLSGDENIQDDTNDAIAAFITRLSGPEFSDEDIAEQLRLEFGGSTGSDYLELKRIEDQWFERYENFSREKQLILNAGLDANEKSRQIDALLRQHYRPEEFAAAKAFDAQIQR